MIIISYCIYSGLERVCSWTKDVDWTSNNGGNPQSMFGSCWGVAMFIQSLDRFKRETGKMGTVFEVSWSPACFFPSSIPQTRWRKFCGWQQNSAWALLPTLCGSNRSGCGRCHVLLQQSGRPVFLLQQLHFEWCVETWIGWVSNSSVPVFQFQDLESTGKIFVSDVYCLGGWICSWAAYY